jgi:hypothetical protein
MSVLERTLTAPMKLMILCSFLKHMILRNTKKNNLEKKVEKYGSFRKNTNFFI